MSNIREDFSVVPGDFLASALAVISSMGGGGGGGGGIGPGFLFDSNTIVVQTDTGGGLVTLTQGVEYTLSGTVPFVGPMRPNNNGHYSEVVIDFAPGNEIGQGQTLRIEKEIFEIYLDGNTWQANEFAQVANYPVPVREPTSLAIGTLGLLRRRR